MTSGGKSGHGIGQEHDPPLRDGEGAEIHESAAGGTEAGTSPACFSRRDGEVVRKSFPISTMMETPNLVPRCRPHCFILSPLHPVCRPYLYYTFACLGLHSERFDPGVADALLGDCIYYKRVDHYEERLWPGFAPRTLYLLGALMLRPLLFLRPAGPCLPKVDYVFVCHPRAS